MIKMIIKKNNNEGFYFGKLYSTFLKRYIVNKYTQVDVSTKYSKGFTLIELMIATTLFTIIMMMGVGSLVVSSNGAKSAQKLRISVDNVNFAMESMTREIRMGTHYYCETSDRYIMGEIIKENDCLDGGNVVEFNSANNQGETHRVAYFKEERALDDKGVGTFTLKRCELGSCAEIVSKDVNIDTLKFYVRGSSSIDNIQPSIRILIRGVVVVKGVPKTFSLQTMASQRSTEVTL